MKTIWICMLVLASGASAARSDDYNALEAGMSLHSLGDYGDAIDAYTRTLAAPGLSPDDAYAAHKWRGHSYLRIGRCKEASADFDSAVALKQGDSSVIAMRSAARDCLAKGNVSPAGATEQKSK